MTPNQLGCLIRSERKRQGLTQADLALVCGTGVRFIVDAENGKETCHIGKILHVISCLGLNVTITPKSNKAVGTLDKNS